METSTAPVSVLIVANNSERFLHTALECCFKQTKRPAQIIVVDTGSKDPSYLEPFRKQGVEIFFAEPDSGFCVGNNVGYEKVDKRLPYLFLLNPDAFIEPDFLEKAVQWMEANPACGAVTGCTLGFDLSVGAPSGKYDTTGIFHTWFGKWFDRAQGSLVDPALYKRSEQVPAICGAVFFLRQRSLEQVLVRGKEIFDSAFYMYKEDIDLSIRLKQKGWQLWYCPELVAYHCRGWNPDRSKMPRRIRLASAKNECTIHRRLKRPIPFFYSSLKYLAVRYLDA